MIAKISKSGTNFYAAALYNQNKVDKKEAVILLNKDIPGSKPIQIDNYLRHVSSFSSTKKPVFHLALSFSEKDKTKLNDAQFIRISQDYLEQMGYGKQPYIIYRHDDTKHPHVHVLTTRVSVETGKKINDSYEQKRSKKVLQGLEKKHDLTIAEAQNKQTNPVQKTLVSDLQIALKNAPTSIAQLNKNLGKNTSSFRAKRVNKGLIYYKIGANQESENRKSQRWKSSLLKPEGLDKKSLDTVFANNQSDRKYIRNSVDTILSTAKEKGIKPSLATFEKGLYQDGIRPKYARNEQGIFGLSYQYKDKLFKSSDLGKGHSWNQLKAKIELPQDIHLREQLKDSIATGQQIRVNYQGDKFRFETSNKPLERSLNRLPNEEASQLVQLHNGYQERVYQAPTLNEKALLKDLAGHDIDEYLQNQYRRRLRQQEQQNKRNIRR